MSVVCLLLTLPLTRSRVAAQEPNPDTRERFVEAVGRIRQSAVQKRNEFILRAPANRVAEIARRHRLTIIRPIDSHSHDVFLVEGPSTFGRRFDRILDADLPALEQLVGDVQGDRDVQHFESNAAVVTPELASGINLNQTAAAIQASLSDRTIVDYFGTPAWRGYVAQPAAGAIHLSASQEAGATGAGIVAIIDTGVDPNHPLLQGSLVPGYDFITDTPGVASEWSDVDGSLVSILDGSLVSILDGSLVSILDQTSVVVLNGSTVGILDQDTAATLDPTQLPAAFGHGTMVAGLVHLVAPTAKIMPLKAFRADGTSTVFDVVRAIQYAVEHGARVINMSFSATAISPEIAHAINVATSMGVICVASAGNLGQELLVYPAALRNVLSVASTTSATPATRSSFSNYGAALVSLGAPGEGVITSYPGGNYAGAWGTSFSAPLAAGAAALLLQADPTLDQAKADILLGNADRLDAGTGKGRLNLDQTARGMGDATPPSVTVTAPTDGGAVFNTVNIAASASDNIKVAGVTFFLDDKALGPEDAAAPYEATWWTTDTTNGSHVVKAVARDGAGNQSSSSITVTVSNDQTAPTVSLTNPAAGTTVIGMVTLNATATDDHGVFGVQFKVDGALLGSEDGAEPFEAAWDTLTASNGTHTLTAVARDAAGKETTASVIVTVANDRTAPTVALTAPVGDGLGGIVSIGATATDDVGVVGVQFRMDGVNLGVEDTSAPYEVLWPPLSDGQHTLTAIARDAAGNQASTSLPVMVANEQ
jgi:subtilisin family serine protease